MENVSRLAYQLIMLQAQNLLQNELSLITDNFRRLWCFFCRCSRVGKINQQSRDSCGQFPNDFLQIRIILLWFGILLHFYIGGIFVQVRFINSSYLWIQLCGIKYIVNNLLYMAPKSKQQRPAHSRTQSELFQQPFPHKLITNFLSPEVYSKTFEIYNKLQFKQKQSDLFNFFQTNELNSYQKLNYFKDELDSVFWSLPPMNTKQNKIKKQDTFYNIFASYYFEGNYLLCHDDIVEDRLYAFSYYLEDHDSGDLVFFNDKADKEVKRIKVKQNTLAIFEVSDISYHEVDYTATDGRKAITGWFNVKGLGSRRKEKTITSYIPQIPKAKDAIEYPLPPQYVSQEYFQLMDIKYQFNVKKSWVQGPFFSRRVHKIEIDPPVLFTLPNYKLYSVEFYDFKEGDYILLNDPVNTIKAQEIIDIFVAHLPDEFEVSEEEEDMLVKIAQEDQQTHGIPEIHDSLFVVRREKKQYYVDRVREGKEFKLAHFIYFKQETKKKSKKRENAEKVERTIVPSQLKEKEKPRQKVSPKPKQTKPSNKNKAQQKSEGRSKRATVKPNQKSTNTRKIKKGRK